MAARSILKLLYTEKVLMVMDDSLSGKFSEAFKNKMLHFFDDVSLMLEYGIAAFLDPR